MAAKLTMISRPDKATVNNSGDKVVGYECFIEDLKRTDPFKSLFTISTEVYESIKADMKENGFDSSKPVNVWRTEDGEKILIDGYTRVRVAEELGFLKVVACEKRFADVAEALDYAVKVQVNRRNLSDAQLIRLIELYDIPMKGFHTALDDQTVKKTAQITADKVGTSTRKVERVRKILTDPKITTAVKEGKLTINRAADIISKRSSPEARIDRATKKDEALDRGRVIKPKAAVLQILEARLAQEKEMYSYELEREDKENDSYASLLKGHVEAFEEALDIVAKSINHDAVFEIEGGQ